MKKETLSFLRCPKTHEPLKLEGAVFDEFGECLSGVLKGDNNVYEINGGFIDFVNTDSSNDHSVKYDLARNSYVDKLIRNKWTYREISVMDGLRLNINKILSKYLREYVNGRVLEIGAGGNYLKENFSQNSNDWISTDYDLRASIDLRCDAMSLPFKSETFHVVVCVDVLEHVEDPVLMMKEISRVLVKGGVLILSTPFFFYLHEAPYDFFRFSKYGLKKVVVNSGLSPIEMRPTGGLLLVFGIIFTSLIVHALYRFRLICNLFLWINKHIQHMLIPLDKFLNRNEKFSQGNFVLAKKK